MKFAARLFFVLPLLIASLNGANAVNGEEADSAKKVYLFSYFTKNGEDGLHLAWSRDGLKWNPLKEGRAFFKPPETVSRLVRDPSIVRAPDGVFHMVWTGSWSGKTIGYASSKDLIHWTDVRSLPVMTHEPTARNCWAPELFRDGDGTYYIIWSTTIPGRFPETAGSSETDYNHRMYYTTTRDFKTFADTKPYWNPGHNVIDGFLVKGTASDCSKGGYILFYKDETLKPEAKKHILVAVSDSPIGPFDVIGVASHINWSEGPAAIRIAQGANAYWYLYYDCYTKHHFGAVRSKDLRNWENLTDKLSMPQQARHGTVFEVDEEFFQTDLAPLTALP